MPMSRRQLLALAGGAAFVSACSSANTTKTAGTTATSASPLQTIVPTTPTSTAPPATSSVPDTVSATTTPSSLAPATDPAPTDAPATTDLPGPSGPVAPLTGLPVDNPESLVHAAVVVKIDNNPLARPQFGLNQTDIVFEEIVEVGTRFFTIFHSQLPTAAGPIRSARTQDVNMVKAMNVPLFMWSGGNPGVTNAINNAPLRDMGAPVQPVLYHRIGGSYAAPHNLIGNPQQAVAQFGSFSVAPKPIFRFRLAGTAPASAVATGGVDLLLFGFPCEWRWNAAKNAWLRTIGGNPHKDHDGVQVNAANVIVLTTNYLPSPVDAHSPEAQTVGSGDALVFTGGLLVRGRWSRPTASDVWDLRDSSGAVIGLAPGRSWVELAKAGDATVR
jgi:Protein of unknown function (DUF3048) N-terminal domain/Protein of unknown function (DUF3048) C-terminal domain